eukprot:TRINITY_DN2210_c0_g1_i1.p1 TRINITY_DN2210_c0_g1~~TRINITY_DN2210_c0_g1_i1.p1  ORF type:complete len:339 (+),score=65.97 TRINITY_DN2210_c0_g1_i1:13-1029(+)
MDDSFDVDPLMEEEEPRKQQPQRPLHTAAYSSSSSSSTSTPPSVPRVASAQHKAAQQAQATQRAQPAQPIQPIQPAQPAQITQPLQSAAPQSLQPSQPSQSAPPSLPSTAPQGSTPNTNNNTVITMNNTMNNTMSAALQGLANNNPVVFFLQDKAKAVKAPRIQNVVSTLNVKTELKLQDIALKARNTEYNPSRFGAVIMRIRDPKTTALIFKSGKIVCTGAKTMADSRFASRKYVCILRKLGFNAVFADYAVQNIVASFDFQHPVRLEALLQAHAKFCNYEPELFPGLVYRMLSPRVVLLIFVSGKVVITGAKNPQDVARSYEAIYPVLESFKKARI